MAITVKPGTALLPLDEGLVQVGTSPGHSFTLANLSAADQHWLSELVKPSSSPDTKSRKVGAAAGFSEQQVRILNLLDRHDLLGPVPAPAPLADLRVRLVGLDRVGIPLARLLFASKVRYLDLRDSRPIDEEVEYLFPANVKGLSRRDTLKDTMRRGNVFLSRQADPQLVISMENRVIDHQRAGLLLSHEMSQLPIIVDDRSIQVGPFVIPSVTCCFLCLDFHRTDEVASWPQHREILRRLPAPTPSPALATTAAALAVQQIEAVMAPASPLAARPGQGAGWYHGLAWRVYEGGVEELWWDPHPRCNCQALP